MEAQRFQQSVKRLLQIVKNHFFHPPPRLSKHSYLNQRKLKDNISILKRTKRQLEVSFFYQLAREILKELNGRQVEGELTAQVDSLQNQGLKDILKFMVNLDLQSQITRRSECLQELYSMLFDLSIGFQKQQPLQSKQSELHTMFSLNIFSTSKPKFFIDQKDKTFPHKNTFYNISFRFPNTKTLKILLQHKVSQMVFTVQLSHRDLPPSICMKDMQDFYNQLIRHPAQQICISPSGVFSFRTCCSWEKMRQLTAIDFSFAEGQERYLNQLAIYREILDLKADPHKQLSSDLKEKLSNLSNLYFEMGVDLFKEHQFKIAAMFFRKEVQQSLLDEFVGRGNDQDTLQLIAQIYQRNDSSFLEGCLPIDCLFICEYIDVDRQQALKWYSDMRKKYPNNSAILYGILNFTYNCQTYQMNNNQLKALCEQLRKNMKLRENHSVKMLLANIYHYRLGNPTRANTYANQILKKNPQNITAKMIIYHRGQIDKQKYVKELLNISENVRHYFLKGYYIFHHTNQLGQAQRIFKKCLDINPYYIPVHRMLIDVQTRKLDAGGITLINWIQATQKIQKECLWHNPKEAEIIIQRAIQLERRQQHPKHIQWVRQSVSRCLSINPTFPSALALQNKIGR